MPEQVTRLRIFVASPSDVQRERDALDEVVEDLNHGIGEAEGLDLKLVRWETHAYPALGPVQTVINEQVEPYDIFVGIFWKRFGTPTLVAASGTEEEFQRAYESWKETKRPPVLFYFCERPFMPKSADELGQMGKVLDFKKTFPGLFWTFESVEDFKHEVHRHLEKVIREVVMSEGLGGSAAHPTPSSPTNQATLTNVTGTVVQQGEGHRSVQAEGIAVGNVKAGRDVNIHQPSLPEEDIVKAQEQARQQYLQRLQHHCQILPLAAMGGEVGLGDDVTLNQVYISLNTITPILIKNESKGYIAKNIPDKIRLERNNERLLTVQEAVEQSPRMVLLGEPGAGKSTFAKQLLAEYARSELDDKKHPAKLSPGLTPVLVTLRDLVPDLVDLDLDALPGDRKRSVLAALVRDQALEELNRLEVPHYAEGMKSAFTEGRCLLVLDGLDEVPFSQRERVRQVVTAVIQNYRLPHVLITCRIRSYVGEARLPDFPSYTLAPFDPEQKQAFSQAWYRAQKDLGRFTAQEAKNKAGDLAQAAVDEDLRELSDNPMLLTTMAIIHQREIRLPKERVKLYDQAVDVLLRKWQTHRAGKAGLRHLPELISFIQDDRKLRSAMERLAYEAHRTRRENREAADLERGEAMILLEEPMYLGTPTLAAAFLDYVDQRAGLFAGQGSDPRRPMSYRFPHRTFQEYLAGCYLVGQRHIERSLRNLAGAGDYWSVAVQLGAEELLFNRRDEHKLLDIAYQLCTHGRPVGETAQRAVLWSGLMAKSIGPKEVAQDTEGSEGGLAYLGRLSRHLIDLLGGALPAPERAEAGNVLAVLGDPRQEVMTVDQMAFCYIPAGSFQMGSPEWDEMAWDDEQPLHEVEIPYDYWMGRFPVTVAQWRLFVEKKPHEPEDMESVKGVLNHPARTITWHEARTYCDWLTIRLRAVAKDRLAQEATMEASERALWTGLIEKRLQVGLPSEAEWEKAARGQDKVMRYPWGKDPDQDKMNYAKTGIGTTNTVGCFPHGASPFKVQEMSGTVFEWTRSLWLSTYPYPVPGASRQACEDLNASGPRVLRGGAFHREDRVARSAFRYADLPDILHSDVGFRVVVHPSFSYLSHSQQYVGANETTIFRRIT